MKLGLSTYTYTWAVGVPGAMPEHPLTAHALVDRAARLGAEVVQLADNLPLDPLDGEGATRLVDHARRVGVALELGARGIGREHLRRQLVLARALGSPVLRVVVDHGCDQPSAADVVERLRPLREEFKRAGVRLAIENHDRFNATELREVVIALGIDWTGVCLDTVNSFGALEGPAVVISTLAPLTVNLHVKDFAITRASHAMGFTIEGRPAGCGRLDIPALLAAVRRHREDITAVLELWTPPEPRLEDTIAKEREWAQASVDVLRRALEGSVAAVPDA